MSRSGRYVSRRAALRWLGTAGAGALLAACSGNSGEATQSAVEADEVKTVTQAATQPQGGEQPTSTPRPAEEPASVPPTAAPAAGQAYLAAARGGAEIDDPGRMVEAAIEALGGIERFVQPGFDVIIKPNICTNYYPFEYAATTNPMVVAALVKLALGAGAKRVRVMDNPFGGSAESAYQKSGIAEAAQQAGGEMEIMNPNKFKKTEIPGGTSITDCLLYQEIINCDLLINVPIAKHHGSTRLTLGCKNMLGVVERRNLFHADLSRRIADLAGLVRPALTVIDAVRILMDNGPTGGDLNDVKFTNTIIASHDVIAADSYATGLFGLTAEDIGYIGFGEKIGLGTSDLQSIKIEEITV